MVLNYHKTLQLLLFSSELYDGLRLDLHGLEGNRLSHFAPPEDCHIRVNNQVERNSKTASEDRDKA